MAVLTNTISSHVSSQFPTYIKDSYPNLVTFVKAYYQWLEDSTQGNSIYQLYNLLNYRMIDTTTDQFLQIFKKDYLPYFPNEISLDLKKLLKVATQFYQTKGTENSIEFLFRALYNLDAQIYYPKQNILRVSDGKWNLPQSLKVTLTGNDTTFDISLLPGRRGVGVESNTTCVVESATLSIDPTLNREILEIFISNVSDNFIPGEQLKIICGNDNIGQPIVFEEKIIGSLSGIIVDPNNQGLKYVGTKFNTDGTISYPGDPVSIIGGLASSNDVIQAVAYVGNVTVGSLQSVAVTSGGYGFRLQPNTEVNVVAAPGDTGVGANVIVDGVDSSNQVFLFLNTDSIEFKANVQLGSNNYAFSNTVNANIHTVLGNAFSFANISVAPISHMNVISGGSGYGQIPTLNLLSVFESDLSQSLLAVYQAVPTQNNLILYLQSRPAVQDLGRIAAVQVLNGGSGYSNVTDTIRVDSSIGYGATFDFITGANGTITKVLVTNSGFGYARPKPPVLLANSANGAANSNGTGAVLQAFGDNDGEAFSLSVSAIGRVQTIRMVNRGFDYINTPLVSLKNQDVTIQPISNNVFYTQSEKVFQGANVNTATFIAFVDQYDRGNSILRLYNYTGVINLSQQLIGANLNAIPVSVHVYGNGKAKANAQFFGGLIKYPGFWISTDGQLSADQFLQDSVTYHNYSYLVQVEKALEQYEDTITKILHPAGMRMLGLMTITDNQHQGDVITAKAIQLSNTANLSGIVNINAFSNGILFGSNTHFVGNVNPGDLFTISYLDGRSQTKEVKTVINATALLLDSNTVYFGQDTLSTTNGSNLMISSGHTSNLVANDIIVTNISGNVQTSIVILVDDNVGNVTVNTLFTSNTTNVYYQVYPNMNNEVYIVDTDA
jgi:hypothetical protein